MPPTAHDVVVFAPSVVLTVTVESLPDGHDDIHLHAGGQGFWISRMSSELGARTCLCAPFGGVSGDVLLGLVEQEGIRPNAVQVSSTSACHVQDRRGPDRSSVALMAAAGLSRDELDNLYCATLATCGSSGVAVLAGPDLRHRVVPDVYRRLVSDLRVLGVDVVADVAGECLEAILDAGGLTMIKVSDEDLVRDGFAESAAEADLVQTLHGLAQSSRCVVITRRHEPGLVGIDGTLYAISVPQLEVVDHRGAGDSLTAGTAVGISRGMPLLDAVRLGAAAGTMNVTRHGLASANASNVLALTPYITIEEFRL